MTTANFKLHPQLQADCEVLTDLSLSRVLMMRDGRFWWLILVPRVPGASELHDLVGSQRTTLFDEIELASNVLGELAHPDKINVAALGNVVPQLHIHVVARRRDDPLWPGPVWGAGEAQAMTPEIVAARAAALRTALSAGYHP